MTVPSARGMQPEIPIERKISAPFRLSWGAIFAGLVIALTLQLVLALAGTAVGLAAWDPNSGSALGIGAAIWAIVSILISLYVGGATAGWAAGALSRSAGMLHGTLVWALSTLMMTWLVASGIGAIAGTTFNVVGNVLGATASVAARGAVAAVSNVAANTSVNASAIPSEVANILRETGDPQLRPDSLRAEASQVAGSATGSAASNSQLVGELANMVSGTASQVSRDDIINVVVARTDLSRAQAEQVANRMISLKQTAVANLDTLAHAVGEHAEGAASATASALWIALLGLGLSLAAAVLGAARPAAETDNM